MIDPRAMLWSAKRYVRRACENAQANFSLWKLKCLHRLGFRKSYPELPPRATDEMLEQALQLFDEPSDFVRGFVAGMGAEDRWNYERDREFARNELNKRRRVVKRGWTL